MSNARKMLKVLSLLAVAFGIVQIILGVMSMTAEATNGMTGGIVSTVHGVIVLVAGVFGIKGSNKPSTVKSVLTASIVALVIAIAAVALSCISHTMNVLSIISVIFDALLFSAANNVKKEAADRL